MRNAFLILCLLFFICSPAFAVPDTIQKGEPIFIFYDISSDISLRNKLEAEYDKKYATCDNNGCTYNAPLNAYEKEVVIPFAKQKKYIDYDKLTRDYLNQNN